MTYTKTKLFNDVIRALAAQYNVIVVHRNQNILDKLKKQSEQTK